MAIFPLFPFNVDVYGCECKNQPAKGNTEGREEEEYGITPFAVHLRKIYIHLHQQLKL